MRPGGAEALKTALRRSLWLIVVLLLIGIAAVNAIRQLQGPKYDASARVVLSNTNLALLVTGTTPPYVDPQRQDDYERTLASSPQLFARTAERTGGRLGSASTLESATTVTGGNNALVFAATTDDPRRSVSIANAVANEYPKWRADISGAAIQRGIFQVRQQIARSGTSAPLQDQLNRLQVLKTLNSGDTILVEPASGASKTSPTPIRDSMLGGTIGLLVALLLVGAREAFNTTVRTETDVEESLAVPVLATVQTLPRRTRMVMFGRHEKRFADTYALLAANLLQMRKDAPRTMVAVTSAVGGEGKTTTASNLAVALARRGSHVILADFDVRKPSVADIFSIPPDVPGIVQLVSGEAELRSSLWSVPLNGAGPAATRQRTGGDRSNGVGSSAKGGRGPGSLLVVPAGGSVPAGAVAQSPRLLPLLSELGADADIVVLDTPPALLTVEMAELSRAVDAVLVVVRHGKVTRRSLRQLSRQAQNWPASLVGAVLTDTPPEEDYPYYSGQ